MTEAIKFYSKEVYGQTLFYLASPDQARLWRELTNRKTISPVDMVKLTELTGIKFERVFEKVEA